MHGLDGAGMVGDAVCSECEGVVTEQDDRILMQCGQCTYHSGCLLTVVSTRSPLPNPTCLCGGRLMGVRKWVQRGAELKRSGRLNNDQSLQRKPASAREATLHFHHTPTPVQNLVELCLSAYWTPSANKEASDPWAAVCVISPRSIGGPGFIGTAVLKESTRPTDEDMDVLITAAAAMSASMVAHDAANPQERDEEINSVKGTVQNLLEEEANSASATHR